MEPTMTNIPRTWSLDQMVDNMERRGRILQPFTPDERATAHALAAAWHFWMYAQDLPGRCLQDSREWGSLMMGIIRMRQLRGDVPEDPEEWRD
jgi:hypothetical protein